MARTTASPICVRLPEDLDAAIRARCEAEGLTPSELMRSLASQYVYNDTPSVDAGYMQARTLAAKMAHAAVSAAIENLPQTFEEANHLIATGAPFKHSRKRHR